MNRFYRYCSLLALVSFNLVLMCSPMTGFAADFSLQWNANSESDLQGYYVYYQEGSSVVVDPAGAVKVAISLDDQGFDPENPSHPLNGLKDDTRYYFSVSAYNAAGESDLSDEVSLSKNASGSSTDGSTSGSGGSGGCFIGVFQYP